MRGKPPALPLTVNKRQLIILKKQFCKVNILESFKQRVGIILSGSEGKSISQTSKDIGVSRNKVSHWRDRWKFSYQELLFLESDESIKDHEILKKIKEILTDKPRSGAPPRITLYQKELITALACKSPKDYGIPMTNWTHQMLAHVAMADNIVDKISKSHIGNILKKTN